MRIYWRPKPTIVCAVLILGMLRLAVWQWDRHLEKQVFIKMMEERLALNPLPIADVIPKNFHDEQGWTAIDHRRVLVKGTYDFANEVVLRNRRLDGAPGVYVLTPLKLEGIEQALLVTRGFVPLSVSSPEKRKPYQKPETAEFVALLKDSVKRKLFSPEDPPSGPGLPRVDQWLRVDLPAIERQLPYPLMPLYAEIMTTTDLKDAEHKIVRTEKGREELLFMGFREQNVGLPDVRPGLDYPVPVYDAVIPPGRHFGYVYEWSFMALSTALIGLVIQLRPPRKLRN